MLLSLTLVTFYDTVSHPLEMRPLFLHFTKLVGHKDDHVRNIHSRTNIANTDSLNTLLLFFHQIRYTRVSGNVTRLTSVCVIQVSLSSLCNSFRSPSQIFPSLSCSIFDTTDVCGPIWSNRFRNSSLCFWYFELSSGYIFTAFAMSWRVFLVILFFRICPWIAFYLRYSLFYHFFRND